MPAMQPIDRDVLAELRRGDEQALERVFRSRFAPLAQQATAALEDEVAAPRVVETAFVRVWEERDSIESPEALEAFLFDAVKSGAARERSRRAAAHRLGTKGPNGHEHHATTHAGAAAITVDDAWAHVSHVLHTPAGHSPQVDHALHEQHRHDAATHVAAIAKGPAWQIPTAIAVVLAIAIFGGMRWMDRASVDTAVTSALNSPEGRNVSTIAAQMGASTLTDGSRVQLGPDTRVRVPSNFGPTMRAVRVEGAASFAVTPVAQGQRPLTVRVGDASITVTGTTLDVRAYPNEPAALIRVREGKVTVKSLTTGATRALAAGQALAVSPKGEMTAPSAAQQAAAFAWTDKRFVVNGQPLGEVLPQLSRWYGLDLKVADKSLLTRPVTLQASLESSREVIAALEKSANVKFGYEDKTMVLTDAAAAK